MASKVWEASERSGLGISANGKSVERFLSVPLNYDDKERKFFNLYYFINQTFNTSGPIRTVLFCSGGPGELVQPGDNTFVDFFVAARADYQVVYFHLRGSGLSQIPPSNTYDKYLRTAYAVRDIELIRKDVLGNKPWDGIVGYSYGTILAQQYARKYGRIKVRKMIIIGPISMHMFKSRRSPEEIFNEYQQKVRQIRETVLKKIFKSDPLFQELTDSDKSGVIAKLTEVFAIIENSFGSERFIAENYQKLKKQGKLTQAGLVDSNKQPYKEIFFKHLRELRDLGWQKSEDNLQESRIQLAKMIAVTLKPRLADKLGKVQPDDLAPRFQADRSYRTLYVMRGLDGFHPKFLKEYLGAKSKDPRRALKAMTGNRGMNRIVDQVGITREKVKIWDPADYKHAVPTLILKGDADPVSANGQAERYRDHALTGEKLLIEFVGVGHDFDLPRIAITEPFLAGTVPIRPGRFTAGQRKLVSWKIPTTTSFEINRQSGALHFTDAVTGTEGNIWALVLNDSPTEKRRPLISLTIRHSMIKETAIFKNVVAPARCTTWIKGRIEPSRDHGWYELIKPRALEEGLSQSRLKYIPPDGVSAIFKNRLNKPVVGKRRNWIWRPKDGVRFHGICQGRDLSSRDCLIYAFFEMDFEDFISQDSPLFRKLRKLAPKLTKASDSRIDPAI